MKLLTKEVIELLKGHGLYSGENVPPEKKQVLVKFFSPSGRYTFYVTEANAVLPDESEVPMEKLNGTEPSDVLFFGFCVSPLGEDCDEWGYASLNELQSIRGKFGLGIERDIFFKPCMFCEVVK